MNTLATTSKMEEDNEPRVDIYEKVTGEAKYVEDFSDPPGLTYGAVVSSPYSHARILSIDSSKAEQCKGVIAVLHRDRLGGFNPALPAPRHELITIKSDQTFIAVDKVRFDGELVGLVIAEDPRTAREAAEMVEVEYQVLPPVFDAVEALSPSAPIIHENSSTNLLFEDRLEWGDLVEGFRVADLIFDDSYTSPSMFHYPMENIGGAVAQYLNDEIVLLAPTTSPFRDAQEIGRLFGIDPERVHIRVPYVGGGFGSKQLTTSIYAALFLSRQTKRPVKLIPTVQESFRQNARHAVVYNAKIGVKTDGTITALDVNLVVDTGAYTTGAATATHNAVISAWGCYRIPHVRIVARCAYTNKVPASHARATGKVQTTWGVECLIDTVADKLGMSPIEIRKKNVLKRGEFVIKGTPPMDSDYIELMEGAVKAIGWDGGFLAPNSETTSAPIQGTVRGRGLALSLRHGSQGGGRAYAMASMSADGVVKINHNAPEIGQGTHNVIRIVAAKTLGLPVNQIVVSQPDTSNQLPFVGVHAQRTTVQMGKAVENTCENLKKELIVLACEVIGGKDEEWKAYDGRLWRAERSFSFTEILKKLGANGVIKSIGFHSVHTTKEGETAFPGIEHWAPSAGAVELEVDTDTGEFRVLQFSVVVDAGKVIHRKSAQGQTEGGVVMGFGHALFEEVVYDEGKMLNGDPLVYRLPINHDIPQVLYTAMLENCDGPGPFGSKGMSQTSIVTVAPAIGNAIYDAVRVRIRSLPITPEKILKGLGKIC